MPILLNDNLNIAAPRPVDSRYGPYASTNAALTAIPEAKRYQGLVVGILENSVTVEYWFKNGITNSDLVAKTSGSLTTNELSSLLGASNGIATLGADSKLTSSQLPEINTTNIACLATAAVAGLVPQLDADGHIYMDQLPPTILGAMIFRGLWDAGTNTPDLVHDTPDKGDYYIVSVQGTTTLGGHNDWLVGDLVIWIKNTGVPGYWDKVPGHNDEVISVNNQPPTNGNITLNPSNIGAVSTADLTILRTANKVPQLTSDGYISTAQISAATTSSIGGVIVGSNINVDTTGLIYLSAASTSQLGLLQVGDSLNVDSSGIVSVDTTKIASLTTAGVVALSQLPVEVVTYKGTWDATTDITNPEVGDLWDVTGLSFDYPSSLSGFIGGPKVRAGDTILYTSQGWTRIPGGEWFTTSAASGHIPQLTSDGYISTQQLNKASTQQIGILQLTTAPGMSLDAAGILSLTAATNSDLGGVVVGANIDVSSGTISVKSASTADLGVIQVSAVPGLTLTTEGILSLSEATTSQLGGVIAGSNIDINAGTISVKSASTADLGVIQVSTVPGLTLTSTSLLSLSNATTSQIGGVIVGNGLLVDTSGIVSLDSAGTY